MMLLQEPQRRGHLWALVKRLGEGLGMDVHSPIVPLLMGSETAAVAASAALLGMGFYVPAIRPPTVPPGTSRWASCVLHTRALCPAAHMHGHCPAGG